MFKIAHYRKDSRSVGRDSACISVVCGFPVVVCRPAIAVQLKLWSLRELVGFTAGESLQIRCYQSAVAMRLGTWLASTKLTLLPGSSTTSRTTDGDGVFLAEFFCHGANQRLPQKPCTRLVNFERSILNRSMQRLGNCPNVIDRSASVVGATRRALQIEKHYSMPAENSEGHSLRFGLRVRLVEPQRFPAFLRVMQPDFSAVQTACRRWRDSSPRCAGGEEYTS